MALESTKSALQKRLEDQLDELQQRVSQTVTGHQDTTRQAARDRWDTAKNDPEAFLRTYLPHYVDSPSAEFHRDLDRMVYGDARHIHVVHGPRDHAKSTRVRAALLLRLIEGGIVYPLMISEELGIAKEHLLYFIAELTSNQRIRSDIDVDIERESLGDGVLRARVTPPASTTSTFKMEAASYGTKIKGKIWMQHRPDFAFLDDMEDTRSSRNQEIAKDKVTWVKQEVYPAMQRTAPIMWVGNTGHTKSALYTVMLDATGDEDALRAFLEAGTPAGVNVPAPLPNARWMQMDGVEDASDDKPDADAPSDASAGTAAPADASVKARRRRASGPSELDTDAKDQTDTGETATDEDAVGPAISIYCYRATTTLDNGDTVYLWPQRYAPDDYERMRLTMGDHTFESEMNGCPVLTGVFFSEDWFPTYDALPDDVDRAYLWFDPAFGQSGSASFKAVVAVATNSHQYAVLDAWVRQSDPLIAAVDAIYTLFQRHESLLYSGGYENDFAQDDRLRSTFRDAASRHGWSLPIAPKSNTRAGKDARIESMEGLAMQGRIRWPSQKVSAINHDDVKRLKNQMLAWPQGADDGPDALESAIFRLRDKGVGRSLDYESMGRRRYADTGRRRIRARTDRRR